MAYSLKKIPNDLTLFPPVQAWMSWVGDATWEYERDANGEAIRTPEGAYVRKVIPLGEGKLRHHYTMADAKRSLNWIGSNSKYHENPGCFSVAWALYEWVEGEWVLRFSGKPGEARKHNPLWQRKLTKKEQQHPIDAAQEEAAIRSILSGAA